jgi:ubiquinone/menaquinone biosynthesis C-methylase UbiE
MPNDDQENDRLDIHHHIALLHLGGELYVAPIGNNPDRILDLGTGTGMWAMDMGEWDALNRDTTTHRFSLF